MSEILGFPHGKRPGDEYKPYIERPCDTELAINMEWPPEEMVEMPARDMINSPAHYKRNGIEAVDLIEHAIEDFPPIEAYHIATVLKYLLRAPYKGNKQDDIKKAHWHLSRLVRR